jgi:hypothetical protein
MRWMRFIVLLLLLTPWQSLAQRYSEGACLLLQQQIDRYANQRSNPNYRSARREYDKYCYTPTSRQQVPATAEQRVTPPPVAKAETQTIETVSAPAAQAAKMMAAEPAVVPVAPADSAEGDAAEISQQPDSTVATNEVADAQVAAASEVIAADIALPDKAQPVVQPAETQQTLGVVADNGPDMEALLLQLLLALPLIAANIVAFLLTNWLGLNLPGFKGVFAEYKLNRLLRWRLSKEYLHFRKLQLTNDNNETTVIDHLLLSPYGIFVIMVKGYRGMINGSESQANWTRDYLGTRKQFMNPLHQNFKNLQALKQLLQLPGFELLHSVIAFARVGQFASDMPANITYIDTTSDYVKQCTEPCISDEQLARFAAIIQQVCADA